MKLLEHHYNYFAELFPSQVPTAVPVDLTEVAKWYYQEAEIKSIEFRGRFPTIASPWPTAAYEYAFPPVWKAMKGGKDWVTIPMPNELIGKNLLCVMTQVSVDDQYDGVRPGERELIEAAVQDFPNDRVRFVQLATIFLGDRNEVFPGAEIYTLLDQEGRYMKMGMAPMQRSDNFAHVQHVLRNYMYPVWFAISMLHCKNVHTAVNHIPPKLLKSRLKAGKTVLPWRQIVIDPMRKRTQSAGQSSGQNSVSLALRIARGHWKSYLEGKGLFGKIHGRFWWDNIADGSMAASYEVKPPYEVKDDELRPESITA